MSEVKIPDDITPDMESAWLVGYLTAMIDGIRAYRKDADKVRQLCDRADAARKAVDDRRAIRRSA